MADTSDKTTDSCDLLHGLVKDYCEHKKGGSAGKDPCSGIPGPAKDLCESGHGGGSGSSGITGGASDHVKDLAESLIRTLTKLLAPGSTWAPEKADSGLYAPFLWLGQHLAVAIFVCVVVVCALTAWQGTPRLRQMGASMGAALGAVAGMAAVPGVVLLLNRAVSSAFTAAFNSNQTTLFGTIGDDLQHGADANPVGILVIMAMLVVALAFAALVFLSRNLGILAFVCIAPLVLASLARGGDTAAVRTWANRLLGLMFCPFVLLLLSPFVQLVKGSLVMDSVLLVAADALMLRMIFHGVPYLGPRIAGAARELVELHTTNPVAHAVARAGVPRVYEQETSPRGRRTVDTPGHAVHRDRGVLFAAYGLNRQQRPARLTTASAVARAREEAARGAQVSQARREARAAAGFPAQAPRAHAPGAGDGQPPQAPAPAPRPRPDGPHNP